MDLAQHYLEYGTVPPATSKTCYDDLNVVLIFQQGGANAVAVARAFVAECFTRGYKTANLFATSSDVSMLLTIVPDLIDQLMPSEVAELKQWPYVIFHTSPAAWERLFVADSPVWVVYQLAGYTSNIAAFIANRERFMHCLRLPITNGPALKNAVTQQWQIELVEKHWVHGIWNDANHEEDLIRIAHWCSIKLAAAYCNDRQWPHPVNNLRLSWRRRISYAQKYRTTWPQPPPFSAHLELYPAALYNMTDSAYDTPFFRIMAQLPPELRMLIANLAYGNPAPFISDADLAAADI